jgi:predicted ester cyclase
MAAEYATTLHRWFEEVWNQGREDVMDEIFPPEGIAHGLGDAPVRGAEEYKPFFRAFKSAFPDINVTISEYMLNGDRIAAHCRATAVHAGKGLGFGPTGRSVDFEFMAFATIKDGKIMEARNIIDFAGMYQQMGVFALRQKENETLLHRWFDQVWNEKRESAISEMLHPEGVHYGVGEEPVHGVEGFVEFFRMFSSAFPDLKVTIHDAFSVDDKLCARYTATGTHTGDGLGFAPTNKEVYFHGMGSCVVKEGKFVEVWNQIDFLGIYRQLGVVSLGGQ